MSWLFIASFLTKPIFSRPIQLRSRRWSEQVDTPLSLFWFTPPAKWFLSLRFLRCVIAKLEPIMICIKKNQNNWIQIRLIIIQFPLIPPICPPQRLLRAVIPPPLYVADVAQGYQRAQLVCAAQAVLCLWRGERRHPRLWGRTIC